MQAEHFRAAVAWDRGERDDDGNLATVERRSMMRRLGLAMGAVLLAAGGASIVVTGMLQPGDIGVRLRAAGLGLTALSAAVGAMRSLPEQEWYGWAQATAAGVSFGAAITGNEYITLVSLTIYLTAWAIEGWLALQRQQH